MRWTASIGASRRWSASTTRRAATARCIKVFADSKPLDLGKGIEVTAKSGPLAVNVRIDGVKELTLEVDFGRRGDVQGHVDWADARLSNEEAATPRACRAKQIF